MAALKSFQIWMFYGLIICSFIINLLFLTKKLWSFFKKIGGKERVIAALSVLLLFSSSMFFFSSVTIRGGYDNNHDFEYLSNDFFDTKYIQVFFGKKEASPLITDGISDTISGFSLDAILIKNRLLIFFTALILLAILLKLKLDYSAVILGFGLFYFNFLSILNANTFATTSSNIFFWMSSLFAIVCFQAEKKNIKSNLIWLLSAMFLTLAGRYELFIVSFLGFLTVVGIYFKERKIGLNIVKEHIFLSSGVVAYFIICLLWLIHIISSMSYNGPDIGDALDLLGNLNYQLIERNAAFFMSHASLVVPLFMLFSFFIILLRGLENKENYGKSLIIGSFLALWIIYFSIIFKPLDLYPLHFMRHRFYFFIPFIILFAFAWDTMIFFLRRIAISLPRCIKFIQILKPITATLLILAYALLNIRTVESLQNEKRTNDIELEFLSKAQREIGKDNIIIYPAFDSRVFLLQKYFPFIESCSLSKGLRYMKYVSSEKFIMRRKGNIIQNYHPLKPNYISKDDKVAIKISFKHKFYTMFSDMETRNEIPIEIGFYFADSLKDKAWILNSKGHCSLKSWELDKALSYFEDAVKVDSDCIVCAYNLSATYAFLGMEKEALLAIKNNIESRNSYGAPAFEKALVHMASNEKESAKNLLENFVNEDMKKNNHQNEILLSIASTYLDKLNKQFLQNEKRELQNKTQAENATSQNKKLKLIDKKKGEEKYKKPSDVAYVKESKKIADMAVKKYMAGDVKGAKADFKKAIKINSGNIEAQITMCSINLSQKDFVQALKYCDTAASIAEFPVKHAIIIPGILADILFLRAEIYGNMKEYKKASFDLKKALRKAPTNWKDFKKAKKK
ncbi:MAG: hypothetical protein L6420_11275, partial [Elusimicrobia bacterium]|nr:hypothetical protein [Elusimicrobiota bacterium]